MRIWLAFSGGGFRATLFHLGVLRRLRDLGVLRDVVGISSVSGGSILAAHAVLNWDSYAGSEESFNRISGEIIRFIQSDLRGHILRRLILAPPFIKTSRLAEKAYSKLYKNATLQDLGSSGGTERPQLLMCTTNLTRGTLATFSKDGFISDASDRSSCPAGSLIGLGKAVAASAAFPIFFAPVTIDFADVGLDKSRFIPSIQFLTDGGVFDNSAARVFSFVEDSGIDLLIISDAGGTSDWYLDSIGLLAGNFRSVDVLMNRVAELEKQAIQASTSLGVTRIEIATTVEIENGVLPIDIQRSVAKIRTDLDRFSNCEIHCLTKHGYTLASAKLASVLGKEPSGAFWSPVSVQMTADRERLEAQRIARLLKKGTCQRLRLFDRGDVLSYVLGAVALGSIGFGTLRYVPVLTEVLAKKGMKSGRIYDYLEVADLIAGGSDDEIAQKFKRGFMNNMLATEFEPFPITGDLKTTKVAVIDKHYTCFIEGNSCMLKVQKFRIPTEAIVVRARSQQTVDNGSGYVATVWCLVGDDLGGFRQLSRSLSGQWRLSDGDAGKYFYTIAYYDGGLFEFPSDYGGAEIDDLCGEVGEASFVIGGRLQDVTVHEIWSMIPSVPVKFIRYDESVVDQVGNPNDGCIDEFGPAMKFFRETAQSQPTDPQKKALMIWDQEVVNRVGTWTGFKLNKIHNDFIFRMTGKRG